MPSFFCFEEEKNNKKRLNLRNMKRNPKSVETFKVFFSILSVSFTAGSRQNSLHFLVYIVHNIRYYFVENLKYRNRLSCDALACRLTGRRLSLLTSNHYKFKRTSNLLLWNEVKYRINITNAF